MPSRAPLTVALAPKASAYALQRLRGLRLPLRDLRPSRPRPTSPWLRPRRCASFASLRVQEPPPRLAGAYAAVLAVRNDRLPAATRCAVAGRPLLGGGGFSRLPRRTCSDYGLALGLSMVSPGLVLIERERLPVRGRHRASAVDLRRLRAARRPRPPSCVPARSRGRACCHRSPLAMTVRRRVAPRALVLVPAPRLRGLLLLSGSAALPCAQPLCASSRRRVRACDARSPRYEGAPSRSAVPRLEPSCSQPPSRAPLLSRSAVPPFARRPPSRVPSRSRDLLLVSSLFSPRRCAAAIVLLPGPSCSWPLSPLRRGLLAHSCVPRLRSLLSPLCASLSL